MSVILHLFRIQKFTEEYLKFIKENFNQDEHKFWIYGMRNQDYPLNLSLYKNAKYIKNINDVLNVKVLSKFDKIIYHGVFDQNIIDFFAKNRKLLSKLYLYFWGGDKFLIGNKWQNLRKIYVVKNACAIINILPEEHRFMIEHYHPKGKLLRATYFSDSLLEYQKRSNNEKECKDYTAVLLGNSASRSNNHIAVLNKLAKFKDENIRIYAPLSYEDTSVYAKRVIESGKKIFGDRFVGVTKFMEINEYYDLLNSMDIGIFDMKRQQALGNISAMLFFEKKVYLRNHSVLKHYFTTENHCTVYTTDEIEQMSFQEFVHFQRGYKDKNKEIMERVLDKESYIKKWKAIFDE